MTGITTTPVLDMLTHDQGMKPCFVATTAAIHTVGIDGKWAAALVINQADCPIGGVILLNREEMEAQFTLIRNAIEDAERLAKGQQPIHAAPSLRRN